MAIVDMKRVFLLGHRQERAKTIDLLHRLGVVELVDAKAGSAWAEAGELLEADSAADEVSRLDARLGEVRYCLDFLRRHFPIKKSFVEQFIGSKVELGLDEYAGYVSRLEETTAVYEGCRRAEEELTRVRNEEIRCRNLADELAPWSGLDLPLAEIRDTGRVRMTLFTVTEDELKTFESILEGRAPDYYLEQVSADRGLTYLFIAYPASESDAVQSLFKEFSATLVSFPDLGATASESMSELERKLTELEEQRTAALARVEELLAHRPLLMACFDYLDNERAKQDAVSGLGRTESSFLLEGWAPAPVVPGLDAAVARETETGMLLARDPETETEAPVLLHNRPLVDSYEVVTHLYSAPQRTEFDPTPLMAPFFFVFFGICLSDAGYGVILSALAFFLIRKLKPSGMGKQLLGLLFLGGISAFIVGLLYGGYMGDLVKLPPLWFDPLADPLRMLGYCFVIGLFQLYFGMGVKAYANIKAGKPLAALYDQGFWFIFLNGLIMLAVPAVKQIGVWVAIGGAVGLVLTQGRSNKGLVKRFFSGLVSLYNVTGYLSDVLSYSRLLALGLATGVIATAVNTMAGLVAGGIGTIFMVAIIVGGHSFNLIISSLSAYVHTSRLQYIEFFGEFYEGGGKPFKPFRVATSFVDVAGEASDGNMQAPAPARASA